MKRAVLIGGVCVLVVVLLAIATAAWFLRRAARPFAPELAAGPASSSVEGVHESLIYGRVTTIDGVIYEGRIRFGGGEEAFWGDYFNGAKMENPWAAEVPPGALPKERDAIELFGFEILQREEPVDLTRPFMVRFGDIARVEAQGRDVYVTLKSGTVAKLDRFSASDFDDGVRVWDIRQGIVDLDSLRIRDIQFQQPPGSRTSPGQLFGTVRTGQADFTGFLQWNRQKSLGSDTLDGRSGGKQVKLPFDSIRSIARRLPEGCVVTLRDGRQIAVSGTRDAGDGNLGIYVDDPQYGRVLVSWDAFERVEFGPGGTGPGYEDFPGGTPLMGVVTTRTGERILGRLVYDLDESEVIETLDAPAGGVDYTILFGLIASIVLPPTEGNGAQPATVTLHRGEQLPMERAGDLGKGNAGMLVFENGRQDAEYIPWRDVARIDLERPPAMFPAAGSIGDSR